MIKQLTIDLMVIDLDNTLYAADNGVFARMDEKMIAYIQRELGLGRKEANVLRVKYWKQYGSTLKGLMVHHGHDAEPFLFEAHDVDAHELLSPHDELRDVLQDIPQRKVIHTNGTTEHAETILNALGIRDCFAAIYDIRFNQYTPKPCVKTLQQLFAQEGVAAAQVLVIDDMEDNLMVAKQAGAKTAWVHPTATQVNHGWNQAAVSFLDLKLEASFA
ncbi:MAG: pyrimidine 5'-nucleotidase [Ghiorsea sp.]|nr:pyrimidine 5'-nucleotidase [Ghiorsea sp.]